MKTKTSLSLFVVLRSEDELLVLHDENDRLPSVDLVDSDGNLLNTPSDGVDILIDKFFKLDQCYVKNNISQTFIDYEKESIIIYHKIVLVKSDNFFNDTVNYVSLQDKVQDGRYYELCRQFKFTK
jgi:hypothetical protein